jgi:hypothetical protein
MLQENIRLTHRVTNKSLKVVTYDKGHKGCHLQAVGFCTLQRFSSNLRQEQIKWLKICGCLRLMVNNQFILQLVQCPNWLLENPQKTVLLWTTSRSQLSTFLPALFFRAVLFNDAFHYRDYRVGWHDDRRMMIWNGFGRKWCWPTRSTISEFVWRDSGKLRNTSNRIAGDPAEIRTEQSPNTCLETYLQTRLICVITSWQ